MASPPIDHFRLLLDHLDAEERTQQLAFFRAILEVGPEAVMELDGRLPGGRAPKALRRLAMEASFYFPWPGWVPIHQRLLRYEADFEIFVTGVRALGRVGSPEALAVLQELNSMRQGGEFQEILAEVLGRTDPQEAFNHYLAHLLQGSAHAGVANEAAQRLMNLVDAGSIPILKTLVMHPDLLVSRHALGLLAHIFTAEAAAVLKDIFLESHREVLADRLLKEALGTLRSLPPAAANEEAAKALELLRLDAGAVAGPSGALGRFYGEVLAATQEGKSSQLGSVLAQAAEALHMRGRRLGFAVDASAEGLVEMAVRGLIGRPEVLDLLVASYREQSGREGVARSLARLVPAEAQDLQHLLLDGPDGAQRAVAVEILGARGEVALEPILLRACRDPLTDIADRARFFIGLLPDADALARDLLNSANAGDFQLGLQLVAEHRFQGLLPDLLALLKGADREELTLQLVEALGAVGAAEAAEPLLEMLHSGQSPRLQLAVAQALRSLASLEVATALCAKVDAIKLPALHGIAAEALAAARDGLPAGTGPLLLDQVRRAWNDRNPWAARHRLVQALQGAALPAPETWAALAALVADTLAEKRSPTAWSHEELHQVQAAGREFARRAGLAP